MLAAVMLPTSNSDSEVSKSLPLVLPDVPVRLYHFNKACLESRSKTEQLSSWRVAAVDRGSWTWPDILASQLSPGWSTAPGRFVPAP